MPVPVPETDKVAMNGHWHWRGRESELSLNASLNHGNRLGSGAARRQTHGRGSRRWLRQHEARGLRLYVRRQVGRSGAVSGRRALRSGTCRRRHRNPYQGILWMLIIFVCQD